MAVFNSTLNALFDPVFRSFGVLSPVWAMVLISFFTGILMLLMFGMISNQDLMRQIKDRIRGNLLAVRLYQHDLGVVVRAQGRVLTDTFRYMKLSVAPMLVMIVPIVLLLVQLNRWFDRRPLHSGESTLLQVRFLDRSGILIAPEIEVPPEVVIETPPVRIPSKNEVAWRVRAEKEGKHLLNLVLGESRIEKEIVVGDQWNAVSPLRSKEILNAFLYPGEPPLPGGSAIQEIEVGYPGREMNIFGWSIHWMALFFFLSIAFGFLMKGFFGVEV